ncbi:gamma-glutamylcyclotransferase, partial [Francisella tularensis subsp. holarctica]|nr:gamma-glutamylcyclotransferase [Francisella tularensis subsp. holarctica]
SLPKGDFWMYVKDFKDAEFPNKDYPILQTYADTFMTGCLQTQAEFNLTEFGKLCFDTTYNWDLANWLYDRSNPRYSRYSQDTEKYRPQIDKIIRRLTFDDDPL